uniref:Calcineurin-like phosphoesterase domain-containing protein n=1 Tax=Mycena chlorophos TaxID=658473 RepID=A0ABQ0L687_MYCCL|nr:predicted protein [Mycena chlorophos]
MPMLDWVKRTFKQETPTSTKPQVSPRDIRVHHDSTWPLTSTMSMKKSVTTLVLAPRAVLSSPSGNARIQLRYPVSQDGEPLPLPKPAQSSEDLNAPRHYTRFVLISDTHAQTFPVPGGAEDILLHAGDLTTRGRVQEVRKTVEWLKGLPHKLKIVIAGNHDLTLHKEYYENTTKARDFGDPDESPDEVIQLLRGPEAVAARIVYLDREVHRFRVREGGKEWSVFGSPWSPEFCGWAFGYKPEEAEELVGTFPQTDILMTHGPPRNLFDRCNSKALAGCPALSARVEQLRPRLHVFGHIHEAHGAYLHRWGDNGGVLPVAQNGAQLEIHTNGRDEWMEIEEEANYAPDEDAMEVDEEPVAKAFADTRPRHETGGNKETIFA